MIWQIDAKAGWTAVAHSIGALQKAGNLHKRAAADAAGRLTFPQSGGGIVTPGCPRCVG
jgi:hypothetical protein